MNVLITGASGFIGSHIARLFAGRHQVTVMARQGSDLRFLRLKNMRIVRGDLETPETIAAAVAGQDLIIHAAAKATDWGSYPDFHRVNIEGSLALIDALPAGARMIHISSNAVLGEEDCTQPKGVDAQRRPRLPYFLESVFPSAMNHYRISKAIAEQLLEKRARTRGISLTIVRPVWVYGPREFHAGPYEYCKTVLSGVPLMPGIPDNFFHVIFVEDLAKIILKISESQKAGVHMYNVGHPEVPKMDAYWGMWCAALGRAKPRLIPEWLIFPIGVFLELLWTAIGLKTPPLFTRARTYMFYASNVYDVRKVIDEFDFHDFTPLEYGIRKTVRWWRMNRFL
ncbi:MAG: NAD-dependent epimerase/dehydratase family protein [Candidatus Riflebacteria bacterium]|nr:NAD-dependent epimerase/dehydratase family protein [Candidatus Riflebacteria bacterium]